MQTVIAIAAGGALGAVIRHFVNNSAVALWGSAFPWGILLINVSGSFVMGLLAGLLAHIWDPSQTLRAFLTVGFLGGFTTFSAFSLDTMLLIERGEFFLAGLYMVSSVVLAVGALAAGLYLVRMAVL